MRKLKTIVLGIILLYSFAEAAQNYYKGEGYYSTGGFYQKLDDAWGNAMFFKKPKKDSVPDFYVMGKLLEGYETGGGVMLLSFGIKVDKLKDDIVYGLVHKDNNTFFAKGVDIRSIERLTNEYNYFITRYIIPFEINDERKFNFNKIEFYLKNGRDVIRIPNEDLIYIFNCIEKEYEKGKLNIKIDREIAEERAEREKREKEVEDYINKNYRVVKDAFKGQINFWGADEYINLPELSKNKIYLRYKGVYKDKKFYYEINLFQYYNLDYQSSAILHRYISITDGKQVVNLLVGNNQVGDTIYGDITYHINYIHSQDELKLYDMLLNSFNITVRITTALGQSRDIKLSEKNRICILYMLELANKFGR